MIQCQTCGKSNADESHFCRFCGNRFTVRSVQQYDLRPPRPYAWKTDEYQTHSDVRQANRGNTGIEGAPRFGSGISHTGVGLEYRGPQDLSGNYRCPYCGTTFLPIIERRISSAGWITFTLLLVFTLVFFWIGLLMKENVAVCPVCKRAVT